MKFYTADWVFTGKGKPLPEAVVAVESSGRIAGVFPKGASRPDTDIAPTRLKGVLTPGFVNAHCHLELSHLKGRIPEGTGLPDFLNHVYTLREVPEKEKEAARRSAEREMIDSGVVAVGDISNVADTFSQKAMSSIEYHTFIELFDWNPERAHQTYERGVALRAKYEGVFEGLHRTAHVSINPHAPYTVSDKLFQLMNHGEYCDGTPMTLHHQETPGENELFESASGPMADFLSQVRGRPDTFRAHEANSNQYVVPLLPRCQNMLLVHNTMTEQADLERSLRHSSRFFWVTCARANWYIERRLPNYELWRERGLRICVGTDSLSSNWDLNFWNELIFIDERVSDLPFEELLQWATLNGAEALELKHLGRLEEGARPGLIHLETNGSFSAAAVQKVTPINTRPA